MATWYKFILPFHHIHKGYFFLMYFFDFTVHLYLESPYHKPYWLNLNSKKESRRLINMIEQNHKDLHQITQGRNQWGFSIMNFSQRFALESLLGANLRSLLWVICTWVVWKVDKVNPDQFYRNKTLAKRESLNTSINHSRVEHSSRDNTSTKKANWRSNTQTQTEAHKDNNSRENKRLKYSP